MRIAVIGAGSYGTCLAKLLGERGHEVALWCRRPELAAQIAATRDNRDYLPGAALPEAVRTTAELADAIAGVRIAVCAVPSHATRQIVSSFASALPADAVLVNATKGLEEGTFARIDQIYGDVLPPAIAGRATFLSGPTFAREVAAGAPSAIVVASRDVSAAELVQREFSTERFRVYTSEDTVGVQVGGALKNVMAIAAGISDGLGFGHNARAALITRGLAELSRIGCAMGANPLTFAGLSGLGDLVLTCTGDLSRNRSVGLAIGRGQRLAEIVAEMRMVAEGVKTARVAHDLAQRLGVSAPITGFVHQVLHQDRPVREAIAELMNRSLKPELG
jgi:glycerol-3-phosphate dehydrogenase (NAD(P)+)